MLTREQAQKEIEDITVDCYDDYEVMTAWEVTFSDAVTLPFHTTVLGMPVTVSEFRISNSNTLQCQAVRNNKKHWMDVEEIEDNDLPAELQHVLTLYKGWLNGDY